MKISVISDTHGYLEKRALDFFKGSDEIWHCGDIGNMGVIDDLEKIAPVRAVHGNIDFGDIVKKYPQEQVFYAGGMKIAMIHIGGYPGKYSKESLELIVREKPNIFLCGHSHILKIMYDKKYNSLVINPGALGNMGYHTFKTAVRFQINNGKPEKKEIFELIPTALML